MLAALAACESDDGADDGPSPTDARRHSQSPMADRVDPVGIIAIGHSGLTAENSDPAKPGQPAPENSWATGTSRRVNSVYLRMVAALPGTEGHVANVASGGAPVGALAGQAEAALVSVPTPAVVIIQSLDSDIRCDGTDAEGIVQYGATLKSVLKSITAASPKTMILLVGQLGRPDPGFVSRLVAKDPGVKATLAGPGICDFYNEQGQLDKGNFHTLTRIINRYEAEQARVCSAFANCRTDGGVRAAYTDTFANFTSDWNHINVRGQAQEANLIWPAVAGLLHLP
jgi:hypothetical protein